MVERDPLHCPRCDIALRFVEQVGDGIGAEFRVNSR
jgi:hypothetical protein